MTLDAIALVQQVHQLRGAEKAKRAFENRADVIAGLENIDRMLLNQILEALGERRLAAADGAEEIKNLTLLLETLRRVLEVTDDTLDRVFHPVEAFEGLVCLDGAVGEQARE